MKRSVWAKTGTTVSLIGVLGLSTLPCVSWAQSPPASPAERDRQLRRADIWQAVHQQLPDLPLENQYISRETGQRSEDNTLVRRLIAYHTTIKGRSPFYRLDWKFTLADYLGVNESLDPSLYPNATQLTQSPMVGDRQALSRLNRAQRDALINTLVRLYNPKSPAIAPVTLPEVLPITPAPGNSQSSPPLSSPPLSPAPPSNPPSLAPLPEPGDADLLRPRSGG